jgi:hypothetical protein
MGDTFQLQVGIIIEVLFQMEIWHCWGFQKGNHHINPYNKVLNFW